MLASWKVMHYHGKVVRGQKLSCVDSCASRLENLEAS